MNQELESPNVFIQELFSENYPASKLEESVIDYVLRCTKGIYKDYYVYLNVTTQGELIGSSSDKDVTLTIEDADLAPKHATIKLEMDEDLGKPCYILRDIKSGKPIWIKIRYDIPVVVKPDMEIKIGKKIYLLKISDQQVSEAQEWLQHTELCFLSQAFQDNQIITLAQIKSLNESQIQKLQDTYNFEKEKLEQFINAQNQINTDFPSNNRIFSKLIAWYTNKKLKIIDMETQEVVLLVGWAGATISSKTYEYSKPPDRHLKREEFEDYEDNPIFEIIIRYMYGRYILHTWKIDNYNIFFRIPTEESHILLPDDTIRLGNIEFTIQRFNTGVHEDQGSRLSMEDSVAMVQDLGVSCKVPVSCYCVFDGHNGDECVKYISQNLLDNLRETILKRQPSFDNQPQFYKYIYEVLRYTFIFTDLEFYEEFMEDKGIFSGCVGVLCMIAGDLLITANVGDCRAILSRNGIAIGLTVDHKPDNEIEKKRILRKGGNVIGNRIENISVSRAFGDFVYKKQKHKLKKNLVSVKPDVHCMQIDYKKDEFIVLCSDGLIDGFQQNQNIVNFIREKYSDQKIAEQDPQQVTKQLVKECFQKSMQRRTLSDNISAIVVNITRGIPLSFEKTIIK